MVHDVIVRRAANLAAAVSVAFMVAMSGAASAKVLSRGAAPLAATVPSVGGRYVPPRALGKGPSFKSVAPKGEAQKQPYPSRYYYDTSRGNYGCHRYGKRAIDTDNINWWTRYKACTETGGD